MVERSIAVGIDRNFLMSLHEWMSEWMNRKEERRMKGESNHFYKSIFQLVELEILSWKCCVVFFF